MTMVGLLGLDSIVAFMLVLGLPTRVIADLSPSLLLPAVHGNVVSGTDAHS